MAKNTNTWTWGREQQEWRRKYRETLQELANLSDSDSKRFMDRVGSRHYWLRSFRSALLQYRDDLRKVWSGDHETTERAIHRWIQEATEEPAWHVVSGTNHGRWYWNVLPNYAVFPLALALGVSELQPRMAICKNPGCPNKYFLKARKTQRFCDRPACSACGQREHKRKWWSEHGKEWKQSRLGDRRSRGRKPPLGPTDRNN
jgi:hypothetical protein